MSDDSDGLGLLARVDGDPVGPVSMFAIEADSGRAFVGAWFVPEAQRKRYGTDAAGRLVECGLDERRLHRIGAGARADDDASRAMLEKLGFVREGRHLSQRGSPAVYGVDETLRVSFAHQNAKRSEDVNESLCDSFAHQKSKISGDVNESKALVRTSESRSDSEDVDETRSVSFVSRRDGVPADSSEISDFRDTRTLRVLKTGRNRVS